MNSAAIFTRSADSFVNLLSQIGSGQWELPGLGMWTVRSLAGHTARAILTVETYLSQEEPGEVTIPTAETYYASASAQFTDPASVEARGVEAGEWLGSDPVGQVSAALARTKDLIESQPPNRIVSIGGMGILLNEYLRTRVLELVVHSIDLSRATGIASGLPEAAIVAAATLTAGIAVQKGLGEELLLALTGRVSLPEGFSVVS
ncbi:MAG: maleylpyruvate isomerase family mycothiol-dependent enzyme [Lacisediminihabitans sp.]